jgi:hypothetical protein
VASTQVKAKVFKQRIRLKDFFIDFDKLRSGYITQAQVTDHPCRKAHTFGIRCYRLCCPHCPIRLMILPARKHPPQFFDKEAPQLRLGLWTSLMRHRPRRLCSQLTRLVGLGPPTQFKSCLTMAGLNLTAEELEVLAVGYANPEDPTLRVHYTCVPMRSVPLPPHSPSLPPVTSSEEVGRRMMLRAVPTASTVFE